MTWLPHIDDYGEVCDCSGEGIDCDGQTLPCPFGKQIESIEYKKFSWMIPYVNRYNSLKRIGLTDEAERLKESVLR
jgi:hypothetical protein